MTAERRAEIVETLESSGREFRDAAAGVSEEAAAASPGPERWSILQVVEHVVVSERAMLSAFERAQVSETSLENREKEAMIVTRGGRRLVRLEAPAKSRPAGRFPTLGQALGQFIAAREQTIRFAAEHDGNLYFRTVTHPLFGPVNGYELLLIIAVHAQRHGRQIAEIRAAL